MDSRLKMITLATVISALLPTFAPAQENTPADGKPPSRKPSSSPQPSAPADAADTTTLSTVTVTAETSLSTRDEVDPRDRSFYIPKSSTALKTDTPIMETPASIQVVPQAVIKEQQAIRVERALQNVSNVFQNNTSFLGSADEFTIRGFNTGGLLFRDYFRFNTVATAKRDPANIEQIEVLKGPASVLFGRIEPGGMVNLITKKPLSQPYYSAQQLFGSYGLYRTTFDATGPLTDDDSLEYRANGAYEQSGSFRQFLKEERFFIAPVGEWNISPDTQFRLGLDTQQTNAHPDSVGLIAVGNRPARVPNYVNFGEEFSTVSSTQNTISQTLTHAFNDQWKVVEQFNSFITNQINNVVYGDFSSPDELIQEGNALLLPRQLGGVDRNNAYSYFNSVNLFGNFDAMGMKHKTLFGGDFFYETTYERVQGGEFNYKLAGGRPVIDGFDEDGFPIYQTCQTINPISIYNPTHNGSKAFNARDCTTSKLFNRTNWYGLYFQDQMDGLPYGLHLLGGLRYDNAHVSSNDQFPFPDFDTDGSLTVAGKSQQNNYRVNPRGAILWNPVDWFTFYGTYVSSFGAVNQGVTLGGQALPPEIAQQWEMGMKTEVLDGQFSATAALFEITKDNIAAADPNNFRFSTIAGSARSRGLELDIAGEVMPGWRIIANYAYTDAHLLDANADLGAAQGNGLPNTPRNAGRVWTSYEFDLHDDQSLLFGGGVTALGQRQGNYQNDFRIPGYATVDIMAAYKFKVGGSQLTAQLNIDNLLSKEYVAAGADFFRNRMAAGIPRMAIGTLRMEF